MASSTTDSRPPDAWKVGAVSELSGVTVRALHHYDHLGLLVPSARTSAGHRLYTSDDVSRLYRISLLRRLGFSLDQIAHVLDDPAWQLREAVERHLDDTSRRIDVALDLRTRLSAMAAELARHHSPSPDELFSTLEEMTMLDSTVHGTTALLVYADIPAAHEYLVRVFGLTAGPLDRDEDGEARHGEVRAGDQVIWLHPTGADYKSPSDLGAPTGMTVIAVDDVDAHHARSLAAGADVVQVPTDQDYGVREYGVRDPEGHLWFFHSPVTAVSD